jgi:hypothetical protein
MAFPGPYATVYYNDAGEPLGWDNNYYDEPEYQDDDSYMGNYPEEDIWYDSVEECKESGHHMDSARGRDVTYYPGGILDKWIRWQCDFCDGVRDTLYSEEFHILATIDY